MTLRIVSLEEKIGALCVAIDEARRKPRPSGSEAQRNYESLKATCADLRGRLEMPRSHTLGELGRLLQKAKDAPRVNGHMDPGRLIAVANLVIGRWPTISQALEQFGEESAE